MPGVVDYLKLNILFLSDISRRRPVVIVDSDTFHKTMVTSGLAKHANDGSMMRLVTFDTRFSSVDLIRGYSPEILQIEE